VDLDPSTNEIITRCCLAVLLGGLLGLEREWMRKTAGLRTHMMVALGSAAFTLVGLEVYSRAQHTGVDPTRLVEGIITGIGFLGAGAIIQNRGSVEGLTTAASIWLVGAVGVASGGGHYVIASMAVGLGLVILFVIGRMERKLLLSSERAQDATPE